MIDVTVVMPCYNGEKYLEKAIFSVINQTYTNWELLVINDNSTDNSVEIIKRYETLDSRIHLINCTQSVGNPSAPRNCGIENAKGRFIAFLDCDDMWLPEKLEKQLPLFNEDNTSVVFSWYEKVNEDGKRQNRIISSPSVVSYKILLHSGYIGNLTGIYDTLKVGKVYQKNINMEDYVMWLDVLKKGGVARNTNTVEALYRITNNSLSSSKLKHLSWQWNVYRKAEKIGFLKSCFLYCCYAIHGVIKYIK